eukprot:jgi/Botrbrau1/17165/Bobra.0157s0059.1
MLYRLRPLGEYTHICIECLRQARGRFYSAYEPYYERWVSKVTPSRASMEQTGFDLSHWYLSLTRYLSKSLSVARVSFDTFRKTPHLFEQYSANIWPGTQRLLAWEVAVFGN